MWGENVKNLSHIGKLYNSGIISCVRDVDWDRLGSCLKPAIWLMSSEWEANCDKRDGSRQAGSSTKQEQSNEKRYAAGRQQNSLRELLGLRKKVWEVSKHLWLARNEQRKANTKRSAATLGGKGSEKRVTQCKQRATIYGLRTAISKRQVLAASLGITSSIHHVMYSSQQVASGDLRENITKQWEERTEARGVTSEQRTVNNKKETASNEL